METTTTSYVIKEITWPEKTFIIKRTTKPFDKLPDFFKESYGAIYGALASKGINPTEMPCAFYYSIDEIKKETELAAAVPVHADTPEIAGFEKVTFPPSKLITTTHIGSYDGMGAPYGAMEKYLAEKKLRKGLVIEEYFSDPEVEKDASKWKTNIYFMIQ